MSQALPALLALLQLGLWLLLLAASLHLLRLGLWAWRRPLAPLPLPPLPEAELPMVTVQLPLRNERYVARRAMLAAAALHWPADRLEIQVLDDSDDDTRDIVDATAVELREAGHLIRVLRRPDRRGFKAGALDAALPLAFGNLVAVLDADFVPAPDFLRQLVPLFARDAQLAFAQGRWSFLNESENLLTRVQALILHGLMLVEQPYLTAHQKPVQFNGTGGIWRKSVLVAAGGWQGGGTASVTEDMDLSYRACLLGYHGRHLPEVAVPTELPATMAAFRIQQQRWVRGGAQVLRSLFGKLRGGQLPASERLTLLAHLLRHVRQPYLALALLWLPLATLTVGQLRPTFAPPGGLASALLALVLAVTVYYGAALRRLGRSPRSALLLGPLLLPLSMGLAVGLTAALVRGLFSSRAGAEFIRTPKTGGKSSAASYRPAADRLARLEVILGLGYVGLAGLAVSRGELWAALGLGGLVAAGLLWVGVGSTWRTARL